MADVPFPKLPSPLRLVGETGERLARAVAIMAGLTLVVSLVAVPLVAPVGRLVRDQARKLGTVPPLPTVSREAEGSTIYASDGTTVLGTIHGDEDRTLVTIKQIPRTTQLAVVAIEDDRFYQHNGVDIRGVVRAGVADLRSQGALQGGSTLTMQYVKNRITGKEKTLERKVHDAMYAVQLEKRWSKDQILEAYLNQAFFGEHAYGIATAAQRYFGGLPIGRLDLAQSAALAATIKAPSVYNPTRPQNKDRRDLVLDRMQQLGFATPAQVAAAKKEKLKIRIYYPTTRQPYFVDYLKKQLLNDPDFNDKLGKVGTPQRERAITQGGLKIYTTLSPQYQKYAQDAVTNELAPTGANGPDGALASIDPTTGRIVAMIGGRNFKQSKVNLAVLGQGSNGYQSGSTFKMFYLVAAMEKGISPSLTMNAPQQITIDVKPTCTGRGAWQVHNAGDSEAGTFNMYEATWHSVNTWFAQLAAQPGMITAAIDVARRMGLPVPPDGTKDYWDWHVCSSVLGTHNVSVLEMANAYGTLANGGVHCEPYSIATIKNFDGSVLATHKQNCKQVIDKGIAAQVIDMLRGVVTRGTGTRARDGSQGVDAGDVIDRPLAGKTGTGDENRTAFFTGFTPNLVTSVHVGFKKIPEPMTNLFNGRPVYGGTFPALIFHDFMAKALQSLPVVDFPSPPQSQPAPSPQAVPNVVGLQLRNALRILQRAGYQPIAAPNAPGNAIVTAQAPPGGTVVPPRTVVTLVTAGGPGPPGGGGVPGVVGQTAAAARAILRAAGYNVNVITVPVAKPGQNGRVINQTPGAGSQLGAGGTVTIWVARSGLPG